MTWAMRAFALLVLGGCRAIAAEPTDEPRPALVPDAVVVQADSAPSTSTPPPLAYNCQAPLHVIEEVTRLLTVAATHATTSAACVDGPGRRIAIDEILVCPTKRTDAMMGVAATYRVTEFGEGGRGYCQPKCPAPKVERARLDVTFVKLREAWKLDVPASIPGLPDDATPVDEPHDGDCYGKSERFLPRPVAI